MVIELFILAAFVAAFAYLAGPGIRASAERRREGESEVLLSNWRDWNGDDTVFGAERAFMAADFNIDDSPTEAPVPPAGVIRIQAR